MRDGFYPDPGTYLAIMRKAFAITGAGGHVRLHWNGDNLDADRFRAEFRAALNRRINHKAAMIGELTPDVGRKHEQIYQTSLLRDCRRVHEYVRYAIVDPINRLETPELQNRYRWRYTSDGLDADLPSGLLRQAAMHSLAHA